LINIGGVVTLLLLCVCL